MNSSSLTPLIVDDEPKSRNLIATILAKYCPRVELLGAVGNIEDAYAMIQKRAPQLLLLDIEMPHGSGFDLLRRLDRSDFEVVFVTGFDHYALQAIKFHALDYLLKPIDALELMEAVEKARQNWEGKRDRERLQQLLRNLKEPDPSSHQLAIPTIDGREYVPVQHILYCTADGSYTSFTLIGGRQLISSKNLGEYEKILPGINERLHHCFFRVHHRYLVNLSFIQKYNRKDNFIQMEDQSNISIAHRRKAKFQKILKELNLY